MSKPFPLQTLLDLARTHSDSAAANLRVLNKHRQEMEERLRLLIEYRNEYTTNLTRTASAGISSADWRNFRGFIDQIDTAIAQQRETVALAKREAEAGKDLWFAEQRKLKSFDTLSDRHNCIELKRESLQEQKEQDEFALKSYLGRRVAMG